MGNLVVQQFVSADGFAANDRNEFDLFDGMEGDSSEFDSSNLDWLETIGAIVLGAATYRMFVDHWPTPRSEGELVGPKINSLPKYVFSRSLESAPWGDHVPATIEAGDAVEAIQRLKPEVSGDLVLWGSLTLLGNLWPGDVVDVVRLVVVPVVLGSGRGVFPAEPGRTPLRLIESRTLGGVVAMDFTTG